MLFFKDLLLFINLPILVSSRICSWSSLVDDTTSDDELNQQLNYYLPEKDVLNIHLYSSMETTLLKYIYFSIRTYEFWGKS